MNCYNQPVSATKIQMIKKRQKEMRKALDNIKKWSNEMDKLISEWERKTR